MSAREMFEELGYKKEEYVNQLIWKNNRQFIDFNKTSENLNIYMNGIRNWQGFQVNDFKLLRAINKQIEELGWND